MARWVGGKTQTHIDAVLAAADVWRERCFLRDGSLLSDEALWTLKNVRGVKRVLTEPSSGASANAKLREQATYMRMTDEEKRLAAEVLWFVYLMPIGDAISPKRKLEYIKTAWELSGSALPDSPHLSEQSLKGAAHPGTYYMINPYQQLMFFLQVVERWKNLPDAERIRLLTEDRPWHFAEWLDKTEHAKRKPPHIRNAILYLLFPDHIERILSYWSREAIVKTFKDKLPQEMRPQGKSPPHIALDRALLKLRQIFEKELGSKEIDFYITKALYKKWKRREKVSPPTPQLIDPVDQDTGEFINRPEADPDELVDQGAGKPINPPKADLTELVDQDTGEFINCPELVGIEPSVYRQIGAALKTGKRHLMFYGPPGTGKTTLAEWVAKRLHGNYRLITGSADWTSQDIIGGYQPVGDSMIQFIPGVLLKNFDKPLIIDELNRCDIDKVIGPLFTVLSGQKTTLPCRTDISDPKSMAYAILPEPDHGKAGHEFAPTSDWRIIATINSLDKAALYQMSFALTRRFAWIYIDVPDDLQAFLIEVMEKRGLLDEQKDAAETMPLANVWELINKHSGRVIGSAPVLDMLKAIRALHRDVNFLTKPDGDQAQAYLDGFYMHILPLLDGIESGRARIVAEGIRSELDLAENDKEARRLSERLESMAI